LMKTNGRANSRRPASIWSALNLDCVSLIGVQ
jgi:hypothetical protein